MWDQLRDIKMTRSIDNLEEGCLTFAKTEKHLQKLKNINLKISVMVPHDIDSSGLPSSVNIYKVRKGENLKNVFIRIHNRINKYVDPKENIISSKAIIDPTAIIGIPGNNITKMANGRIINMKHMGNVIIEDYVEVQALSIVHRSVFDSTIIRKNAQIFAKVNIGHNCDIGESTIICPGSLLAGGTKVGSNCYIWQGVITRSNISICDNVIIGAGSLVLDDIKKPGVYFGSPVKYIKPYDEEIR